MAAQWVAHIPKTQRSEYSGNQKTLESHQGLLQTWDHKGIARESEMRGINEVKPDDNKVSRIYTALAERITLKLATCRKAWTEL